MELTPADQALAGLLSRLGQVDYDFVTTTPATHRRLYRRRAEAGAGDFNDIFGWNLPFELDLLPPDLHALLELAGALEPCGPRFRCRYRVSRVGKDLFVHSGYPTEDKQAVFLGPDSYRFTRFVAANLPLCADRLVDMGTGTGVGAICASRQMGGARIQLVDSNPEALRLARINAYAARLAVETFEADSIDAIAGGFDLFIANPPFIMDRKGLTYRDGGGMLGAQMSLDWTLAAVGRLRPGGRILLYTGSAIVGGRDALKEALSAELASRDCRLEYEEIDPDIFGEQLSADGYEQVERIAAVGAVVARASAPKGGGVRLIERSQTGPS